MCTNSMQNSACKIIPSYSSRTTNKPLINLDIKVSSERNCCQLQRIFNHFKLRSFCASENTSDGIWNLIKSHTQGLPAIIVCNDFLWPVDILDQLGDLPSAYQNLLELPLTNQPIAHVDYTCWWGKTMGAEIDRHKERDGNENLKE